MTPDIGITGTVGSLGCRVARLANRLQWIAVILLLSTACSPDRPKLTSPFPTSDPRTEVSMSANDPLFARMINANGDTTCLYGLRDAAGIPRRLDCVRTRWASGGSTTGYYDEAGNLEELIAPDGSSARVEIGEGGGTRVWFTFLDGTTLVVPIANVRLTGRMDDTVESDDHLTNHVAAARTAGLGDCTIRVEHCGEPVTDQRVWLRVWERVPSGLRPIARVPAKEVGPGTYVAAVPSNAGVVDRGEACKALADLVEGMCETESNSPGTIALSCIAATLSVPADWPLLPQLTAACAAAQVFGPLFCGMSGPDWIRTLCDADIIDQEVHGGLALMAYVESLRPAYSEMAFAVAPHYPDLTVSLGDKPKLLTVYTSPEVPTAGDECDVIVRTFCAPEYSQVSAEVFDVASNSMVAQLTCIVGPGGGQRECVMPFKVPGCEGRTLRIVGRLEMPVFEPQEREYFVQPLGGTAGPCGQYFIQLSIDGERWEGRAHLEASIGRYGDGGPVSMVQISGDDLESGDDSEGSYFSMSGSPGGNDGTYPITMGEGDNGDWCLGGFTGPRGFLSSTSAVLTITGVDILADACMGTFEFEAVDVFSGGTHNLVGTFVLPYFGEGLAVR